MSALAARTVTAEARRGSIEAVIPRRLHDLRRLLSAPATPNAEPSSSSARQYGPSLRTMHINVSSGTRFYAHGVVKLQREETAADHARTSDIDWLTCVPGRNLGDLSESNARRIARHIVTDVRHAPHTQVHALSSPAPVPLSHFEEFFGVPQPVLMAQRRPERSYQLYPCSQDGLSGSARLEACLPYPTGNNARLEEVLGALTLCPPQT